jgi:RNA polymerase primary sigma factor
MATPSSPVSRDPTLDLYLSEIGEVDLLTAQEEKDLARQVADGSQAAFERLILANLRFVVFVAKRYRNRGLPLMDLIAEGNVGLLDAVVRFDPDAGCRFTTYAYWRIMKCISQALRGRTRVVHIPPAMVDRMRAWSKAAEAVRRHSDREPTVDELGATLKLSGKAARLVQRTIDTAIGSVHSGAGQETWDRLAETVADSRGRTPEEEVQHREELDALRRLFEALHPRDQRVLELRFGMGDGEPKTLRAVGAEMQMTHEAARRIERLAIARLRDALRLRRHTGLHATGHSG